MPEGNRRIEIQRETETVDDLGRKSRSWATVATAWARLMTPGGQEFFTDANPVQARERAVFRIRYVPDVQVTDRVRWDGRVYNIHAVVDEKGGHRWLQLQTSAAMPQV